MKSRDLLKISAGLFYKWVRKNNFLRSVGEGATLSMTDEIIHNKPSPKSWIQIHTQKFIVLLFWVLLITDYQWYAKVNHLSPLQVVQQLLVFFDEWFLEIYYLHHSVRHSIIDPVPLHSINSGGRSCLRTCFGCVIHRFRRNISSTIAYFVGYFFG